MAPKDASANDHPNFVEKFGLWTDDQIVVAKDIESQISKGHINTIRLAFADQHGVLRGKTLVASEVPGVLRNGCTIVSSLLAKDTSHRTVFPVFSAGGGFGMPEMEGAADILMVPDPDTFKVLPWVPKTGWLLCDLYFPNGKAVPFSTRQVYRNALARLHDAGFDYVAGLEVEFHIFKIENPRLDLTDSGQPGTPPEISLLTTGYQYLTETRYDLFEPVFEVLRRDLLALGLPLRSLEVEFGPSQCELTFRPGVNLESADMMVLLRSAVKQICRRQGYLATFMCMPRIPNVVSSGWHLHQSLRDRRSGENAFSADGPNELSPVAQHYLAGLLSHARESALFATPTLNGYKRYRPNSMAPDRANWGRDNRGVMARTLTSPGDPAAARVENRIGEPAANPYLYMASQVLSGLDGITRCLEPGPSADTPYETDAPLLPRSFVEAVETLRSDQFFRDEFGADFIDYYLHIKDAELARFQLEITEWEHREYLELF